MDRSDYSPNLWPHQSVALTLRIYQSSKASSSRKSPRLTPIQQMPNSWNYSHPLTVILIFKKHLLSTYYIPGLCQEKQVMALFPNPLSVYNDHMG